MGTDELAAWMNSRLSRVFTILLFLQSGLAFVPYSALESVIEQNKESYYLALRKTQGTIRTENPDWQPWITFFLQALQKQKQRLEKKVEHEKLVLVSLPDLALRIIDFAKEHGRVSIGEMVRLTGASRNTLKQHFRVMVEKNYLDQKGGGRSTWYVLK